MTDNTLPIQLTRKQVREVDRLAVERYAMPGIVLMENAARGAAMVALEMLAGAKGQTVLILCGGGNNGGDGLAIARHLHNAGHYVHIGLCADPARYTGDALINWRIVQAMELPTFSADPPALSKFMGESKPALIVDAIFGTGLSQPPREPFAEIARIVNDSRLPVLAIDIPSGLDCDTGRPFSACIRAARTVTFVARKTGFANPESAGFTGLVSVADIGAPVELIEAAQRIEKHHTQT